MDCRNPVLCPNLSRKNEKQLTVRVKFVAPPGSLNLRAKWKTQPRGTDVLPQIITNAELPKATRGMNVMT